MTPIGAAAWMIMMTLATTLGCREDTTSEEAPAVRASSGTTAGNQQAWTVQVAAEGLALAANSPTIETITVGFVGCSDPDVTVAGSQGTVYSTPACTQIVYRSMIFRPSSEHASLSVAANSDAAIDAEGNTWNFLAFPEENSAVLVASFIAEQQASITIEVEERNPWQNPVDRFDVNSDGRVTSMDALTIVNRLSQGPELPPENDTCTTTSINDQPVTRCKYYDVNGDGRVTSLDALQVNNEISRRSNL